MVKKVTPTPIIPPTKKPRQLWDGTTERRGSRTTDKVAPHDHPNLSQQIAHIEETVESHLQEMQSMHSSVTKSFVKDADGDPDYDGHRRYHEDVIDSIENRKKIIKSTLEKIVGAIAVAGLMWIGTGLWSQFVNQVNK